MTSKFLGELPGHIDEIFNSCVAPHDHEAEREGLWRSDSGCAFGLH